MKKIIAIGGSVLLIVLLSVTVFADDTQKGHTHDKAEVTAYISELRQIEKSRADYRASIDALVVEGTPAAQNAEEALIRKQKLALRTQLEKARKEYLDANEKFKQEQFKALEGVELNLSALPQPAVSVCEKCSSPLKLHECAYAASVACGKVSGTDIAIDDGFIYYYDCTGCSNTAGYAYLVCSH